MKRTIIFILCLFMTIGLTGCGSKDEAVQNSNVETCNLSTYQKYAQPLMQEFSNIVKNLEIREETSRSKTKTELTVLLTKINNVKCRDKFPLKQETLVYSVKHMIDAIDYADKGDYLSMNQSIEKSLLNVETFQDWTVDILTNP